MVFSRKNLTTIWKPVSRLILATVVMRRIYLLLLGSFLSLILITVSPTSGWAQSSSLSLFTPENFYSVIGLLVPGMIILFVRSQFLTGRLNPPHPVLSYLAVSGVYYALVLLVVNPVPYLQGPDQGKWLGWLLLVFVLPAISGFLLGYDVQKQFFYRFLRCVGTCIGLNPAHPIPSAWDWKFNNMGEQKVLVTLKDGTKIAGFLGKNSFVSSDPTERDVYIETVCKIDENSNCIPEDGKGILIVGGQIQTIELWSKERKNKSR